MNIEFRDIQSRSDAISLVTFLESQHLGYHNYSSWLEKTLVELDTGKKSAITAHYNGKLLGNLVYQPHKQLDHVLEIKNIRIHPQVRQRYFANFMLKQMEAEQSQYDSIICDARSNQTEIISFLEHNGFTQLLELYLYDSHETDIVLGKFKTTPSLELQQFFLK